jgi:hypothetical protein
LLLSLSFLNIHPSTINFRFHLSSNMSIHILRFRSSLEFGGDSQGEIIIKTNIFS